MVSFMLSKYEAQCAPLNVKRQTSDDGRGMDGFLINFPHHLSVILTFFGVGAFLCAIYLCDRSYLVL